MVFFQGILCDTVGWESVFYFFGVAGVVRLLKKKKISTKLQRPQMLKEMSEGAHTLHM